MFGFIPVIEITLIYSIVDVTGCDVPSIRIKYSLQTYTCNGFGRIKSLDGAHQTRPQSVLSMEIYEPRLAIIHREATKDSSDS